MSEQTHQYRAQVEAKNRLSAAELAAFLDSYPPYRAMGVRVAEHSEDSSRWVIEMPLTPNNQNYFGTHFGGALYAMCDPFYVLILIRQLGPDYVVWDKAATIRFLKPGTGTVRATFEVSPEAVEEIRQEIARGRRTERTFTAQIQDEQGQTIAEVEKLLYIRRSPLKPRTDPT